MGGGGGAKLGPRAQAPRPRFSSRIRRARVNDEARKSFGEYEVVCALRTDASRVEHETVAKWVVWRRFSDFEDLEKVLKKSLGWQLDRFQFPSKKWSVMDKLAPAFLESRRAELDAWWQGVISVERACDFHMRSFRAKILDADPSEGAGSRRRRGRRADQSEGAGVAAAWSV